jgi:hypothetical protein
MVMMVLAFLLWQASPFVAERQATEACFMFILLFI